MDYVSKTIIVDQLKKLIRGNHQLTQNNFLQFKLMYITAPKSFEVVSLLPIHNFDKIMFFSYFTVNNLTGKSKINHMVNS